MGTTNEGDAHHAEHPLFVRVRQRDGEEGRLPAMNPEVTVIIPTRDRFHFVKRALAVVFAQEHVDIEVIVVDDGGKGDLAADIGDWSDRPVRVLRNESSQTASRSRNRATMQATSPWVAFLDDDDIWAPHRLRTLLDAIQQKRAGWGYGSLVHVDSELRFMGHIKWAVPGGEVQAALKHTNVVGTPSNVIVSTDLARELGGFDPDVIPLEDWEFWLRLAEVAPVAEIREPLVGYVQHGTMGTIERAGLMQQKIELVRAKAARAGVTWAPDLEKTGIPRWKALAYRQSGQRAQAARTYLDVGMRYRNPTDFARAGAALLGDDFMKRASSRRRASAAEPGWLAEIRESLGLAGVL
jgi:Glycosyl transferase family 2